MKTKHQNIQRPTALQRHYDIDKFFGRTGGIVRSRWLFKKLPFLLYISELQEGSSFHLSVDERLEIPRWKRRIFCFLLGHLFTVSNIYGSNKVCWFCGKKIRRR